MPERFQVLLSRNPAVVCEVITMLEVIHGELFPIRFCTATGMRVGEYDERCTRRKERQMLVPAVVVGHMFGEPDCLFVCRNGQRHQPVNGQTLISLNSRS